MNDSRSGFGTLHMPRSRGAVSGLLLILLGAWGALIPFIGPYFHFAYSPDQAWAWSTARAWLEVFPGVTAALGGFLAADFRKPGHRDVRRLARRHRRRMVRRRPHTGVDVAARRRRPTARRHGRQARGRSRSPTFSGLGAFIVFLGGAVLARVTIRTARDVELAHKAELAQSTDAFDGFDTPVAQTEVLSAEPRRHRRESKGGVFRRAPSH